MNSLNIFSGHRLVLCLHTCLFVIFQPHTYTQAHCADLNDPAHHHLLTKGGTISNSNSAYRQSYKRGNQLCFSRHIYSSDVSTQKSILILRQIVSYLRDKLYFECLLLLSAFTTFSWSSNLLVQLPYKLYQLLFLTHPQDLSHCGLEKLLQVTHTKTYCLQF